MPKNRTESGRKFNLIPETWFLWLKPRNALKTQKNGSFWAGTPLP